MLASSPLSASFYVTGGIAGLIVLGLILFAETGLLIGFFLPGDTLLLLFGDYTNNHAGKPHFAFVSVLIAGVIGAFVGAQTGFVLGRRLGAPIFDKGSRRERVDRAEKLLDRFGGGRAVVAARFVPVVRTFMNPVVGLTHYSAPKFTIWNAVGAVLWVPPVLLLGRLVGSAFPLDKIVLVVIVLSLALAIVTAIRERRRAKAL